MDLAHGYVLELDARAADLRPSQRDMASAAQRKMRARRWGAAASARLRDAPANLADLRGWVCVEQPAFILLSRTPHLKFVQPL